MCSSCDLDITRDHTAISTPLYPSSNVSVSSLFHAVHLHCFPSSSLPLNTSSTLSYILFPPFCLQWCCLHKIKHWAVDKCSVFPFPFLLVLFHFLWILIASTFKDSQSISWLPLSNPTFVQLFHLWTLSPLLLVLSSPLKGTSQMSHSLSGTKTGI